MDSDIKSIAFFGLKPCEESLKYCRTVYQ